MLEDILMQGARVLGIELSDDAVDTFVGYYRFLDEKNSVMDLTAITGEKDTAQLHFLDSLALLKLTSFKGRRVIDIGSAPGFPGLPLKLAEPDLSLTLLDAQRKRVAFLEELCAQLRLSDVVCLQARAEEAAHRPGVRDAFDFAVSRAVARLSILCELCLPFVKPGGAFITMKGTDSDDELAEARTAIKTLGAVLEQTVDYEIPTAGIIHRAVLIRKTTATPDGYPRRFARIQNKPL
jgi:16S rRNA (guanine527-N7)-methyltransferase